MNDQKLKRLGDEELQKMQRKLKIITGMLAGGLLLILISALYSTIKDGFTIALIIPISLMPIIFINNKNLTNIKKELESRKRYDDKSN